jgi:signal transduction histidine kinase
MCAKSWQVAKLALPMRFARFWPRSLQGQMLLAIAIALLIAQGLSAALIWRMQHERHVAGIAQAAAFRLLGDQSRRPFEERGSTGRSFPGERMPPKDRVLPRRLKLQVERTAPDQPGDIRRHEVEQMLSEMLAAQGVPSTGLVVVERDPRRDALLQERFGSEQVRSRRPPFRGPRDLLIAAMRRDDGTWLTARLLVPPVERHVLISLLLQTILIYAVLVGAVALILRRLARPLQALTTRVETFARARSVAGQLEPDGPEDIQRLIVAHNAMEGRVAALLDEKDVMLGAIGHDLKTPLAALRVRIEAVEDDTERARMAAGISDINNSLDDILSLARVGRPSDPLEQTELSALVADVVGEFEDMGEPVTLGSTTRMVMALRATWLRRALRNLISNGVRYGQCARVSLAREGREAVLRIEDDGPGIPVGEIARMQEPFTRMEASRNSATGGSGLGLTLARAIADQHGGALHLANRVGPGGEIQGLAATLRLPLD